MGKEPVAPDAWDDDWETQADKADEAAATGEQATISKAERLAKHAETNKKIWESAETLETFHFLAARDTVPLKTEFKPALKVLSRKPAPKVIARQDPVTGLSQMTIEDDEGEDEELNKNRPTAEELRLKAQRDREEKQKKYEEVRARLFGTSDIGLGSSSSGQATPPAQGDEGRNNRGRGRSRGGNRQENKRTENHRSTRELFDPNYIPKPGSVIMQRRGGEVISPERSIPQDDQVIRAPKGPDGSGRGGFGFVKRGHKGG